MSAPAALLNLLWLASPALPVGGFSYSEGLEAAVEAGFVHDEVSLRVWLLSQQQLGQTRAELPLLAQAFRAWRSGERTRLIELNDWHLHTRETAELRRQSEQMGRSMTEWLRERERAKPGADEPLSWLAALRPAPSWPIAFALAAARSGAGEREALLAFGFAWAEGQVQAALKAMRLGQTAGQRVLAALADALPALVQTALEMSDDERQAMAPMAAILSASHETQYSRLFRS